MNGSKQFVPAIDDSYSRHELLDPCPLPADRARMGRIDIDGVDDPYRAA